MGKYKKISVFVLYIALLSHNNLQKSKLKCKKIWVKGKVQIRLKMKESKGITFFGAQCFFAKNVFCKFLSSLTILSSLIKRKTNKACKKGLTFSLPQKNASRYFLLHRKKVSAFKMLLIALSEKNIVPIDSGSFFPYQK